MLDKLLRLTMRILIVLGSVAMAGMIIVICLDVLGREAFNHPMTGAYELVEFLMGVLCPISVVLCIYRNEDICVDLLYQHLSKPIRKIFMLIGNLFVTVTSIFLLWQSFYLIADIAGMEVETALLGISMTPIAIIVMISFLIMVPIQMRYLKKSFQAVDEEEVKK